MKKLCYILLIITICLLPAVAWTISVDGQEVTPPQTAPDEKYYEIVRTQQEDWGTFVTYADKETRNGFLLTYDRNGLPIGMQQLTSVTGESLRYDSKGNLLERVLPEQYKVEIPAIYGRQESAVFALNGSISNVAGMIRTYGNGSKIGLTYTPEAEYFSVYGATTGSYCISCEVTHTCSRPIGTRTVSATASYIETCPSPDGTNCTHLRCHTATLAAKVILKSETDPYTEWQIPLPFYDSEYTGETNRHLYRPDERDDTDYKKYNSRFWENYKEKWPRNWPIE